MSPPRAEAHELMPGPRMAATTRRARPDAGRHVFHRIAVGVDGSQQAFEAARQASLLQDVDGELMLLSIWEVAPAAGGGSGAGIPERDDGTFERTTAEKGLHAVAEYVAPYTAAVRRTVRGSPVDALLDEVTRDHDTLVAVGSSGSGRLPGVVVGAVATGLIHHAPCSVLVCRPAASDFPRRVVVGVDGSAESAAAYATARYVAERFGADLRPLAAWGGKGASERLVATITRGGHRRCPDDPVDALASAAETADLVVVGSSGLHGRRPLGSVSERVAHTASCSALIVRP